MVGPALSGGSAAWRGQTSERSRKMARKNRVVLRDAVYHVTSRVAHGAFLFSDPAFKDRIAGWIHGVAEFSGVEVYAWCVMDNHFHLVVHVPGVPEKYWTDPGREPDSQAFGMRPAECRVPRWAPAAGDSPLGEGVSNGDSPQREGGSGGDSSRGEGGLNGDCPRPKVGFELPDKEMLGRLLSLYGDGERIGRMRRAWAEMRAEGGGGAVDAAKERYARRMYNVSQFVKTLKERIAMAYNRERGHEGAVWQGRFHSSLVEDAAEVRAGVAAYDDYNPVKAGLAESPSQYRWCSFGSATGEGPFSEASRRGYGRLLGRPWEEARAVMEAIFALGDAAHRVPKDGDGGTTSAAQAVRLRVPAFTRGAYIGHDPSLARAAADGLPRGFPCPSFAKALEDCGRFVWDRVA